MASSPSKQTFNFEQAEVRKTELGYVTSVNKKNRTFFVQLCKFTNVELVQFNQAIHHHCKKIIDNGLIKSYNPRVVDEGQIFFARYEDQNWYRIQVMSSDPTTLKCDGVFIDYGNVATFDYADLLRVDPENLPCIARAPFGIHCNLKDSEKLDTVSVNLMLDAVMEEYILIRALKRLGPQEFHVDLPKVAYNSSFWLSYHVAKNKLRTGKDDPLDESQVNQQLLTREEMLAAGLDA